MLIVILKFCYVMSGEKHKLFKSNITSEGGIELLMFRMSTSLPAAIRIFNQSDTCLARVKHMINMQVCSHFVSREHGHECK